ncbi:nitrous oxide reductase accessory protein NosL [Rhodobium orientis]|uniref:nitrous oxide reductase accessory protein NosL n=2 Tax=Rhodobium orientis TaxID=34017 RepID=UPI0016117162|nr:nitrous oxide reductase accessory protein NosL [Rhodobium orientis]MBB4303866.1 nitrous oxide reductase accessory protein NosL [Rhodobium orientis]
MCTHHHAHGPRAVGRRRFLIGAAGIIAVAGLALPPAPALARAAPVDLPPPGPNDTCPVCGMFVAKYPDWIATVLFKDGSTDHFDGAKDFFKYLLDMAKYAKGKVRDDIVGMGVTDYYSTERIDARGAYFVLGSDVLSPMGHDLIPHPSAEDAAEFSTDHEGKKTLRFDDVTMPMLIGLDSGKFDG